MTANRIPAPIRRIAESFHGTLGLAAQDASGDEPLLINADRIFPTASMVKTGILLELYRRREAGQISLDETLTVRRADCVGGTGLLETMRLPLEISLYDLAVLMNALSDNSATNVLIDRLGIEPINAAMRDAGMKHTRLNRKAYGLAKPPPPHRHMGVGSPRDFMTLMLNLCHGRLLNDENTAAMLEIMKVQKQMGNLKRYIDFDAGGRDKQAWIASKTGGVKGVRTECGILHNARGAHVIAVMTKGCPDLRWTPDNEAIVAIARISQTVYRHYRPAA
ncbi:MAG: serine hydrolase [Chloroflexi bacterium]|nr:serine hydrolase [Chloroflexota bacterium]